jgi:CRISPR-associated protein Cas1
MIKRIVEITSPARLNLKDSQMVIRRDGAEETTLPIEDIGILILAHQTITHTQGLFSALATNNVAVVICGPKHLPEAVVLPLEGNSLHSKTIAEQVGISMPVKKRIWQAIVRAKINGQAKVLGLAGSKEGHLSALAEKVRSGDPDNCEAQAARAYWPKLFGAEFRRDHDGDGVNALLNYGYAIMRAAMARAIVGAGLHPSLGLHHKNQYNGFCLADDLVEPLRPMVDLKVHSVVTNAPLLKPELTPDTKKVLLSALAGQCTMQGARVQLLTALHYYTASVRRAMTGETKDVEIPGL